MSTKGKRMYNHIGNFTLESGSLRISDPGYEKDIWCADTVEDGKCGLWTAYVVHGDEDRPAMLLAGNLEEEYLFVLADELSADEEKIHYSNNWDLLDDVIGVDSGQAGIFDLQFYGDCNRFEDEATSSYGDEWFNHCCDATSSDEGAGTIFCGAISSSGYGDGCYYALTHTDREGMVDAVAIIFMEV